MIRTAAEAAFGREVAIVDSANAMSRVAEEVLAGSKMTATREGSGTLRCHVTDASRLDELGQRFLGEPLDGVTTVDL